MFPLDPYKIPRPQLFPRPFTRVLTTRAYGRSSPVHTHRASFDSDGNGITDIVASHFHRILAGRVMPSPVDSHDHELTGISVRGA